LDERSEGKPAPLGAEAETSSRLRKALRDLVALSAIPAAWVGREPSGIAAGLADVLVGSMDLDFALVRFRDAQRGAMLEAVRGNPGAGFSEWRRRHVDDRQLFSQRIVAPFDGEPGCGIVIPIGVDGEGGVVVAASDREGFPDETDQLLLSVAANHAAIAFHNARLLRDRRAAEEAMRESEQRWRSLTEALPHLVWAAAPDGACDYFSTQWTAYTGVPEKELLGWQWMAVLHPDDREPTRQFWTESVAGRRAYDVEYRVRRHDGVYGWFKTRGVPLRNNAGAIVKWFGSCTDITDLKHAEDALRQSEQELRQARDELEMKIAERTAELQQSAAYLAEAQRLSHTGSWAWSPTAGEMTYWSDACYRMLGFDPEQGLPRYDMFLRRLHPNDQARVMKALEQAAATGADLELDYAVVHAGGEIRDIHMVGHPALNPSGGLVEFVGTVIDVTERHRAEREEQAHLSFLESLDRVNRAMQSTNDLERMMSDVLDTVLSIFDSDRAWLVYPCDPAAPSWRVAMEQTRPGFAGAYALGSDLPMDAEVATVFAAARASTTSAIRFGGESEHPVPAQLAARFSIQSILGMTVDPKVDEPYLFGLHQCSYSRAWTPQEERLFREIGRRLGDCLTTLLMFRNLQESEARLEEAQRITRVGYWDRDVDRGQITWSDETYRIFGVEARKDSLEDTAFAEMIEPEDRLVMRRALEEALSGGRRYDIEYRIVRPNGEVRVVHSQGEVVRDELGRPRRMFGTVQDITERKRAEEELRASERRYREAQMELAHANRVATMGQLAASVAHEVSQPIAAAVTNAQAGLRWLSGPSPNVEEVRSALSRIIKDGNRAGEVIGRIRDLIKKAPSRTDSVDINATILDIIALTRSEMVRHGLSLKTALTPDLPLVEGDRVQLQQVVLNLVVNAIEAMSEMTEGRRELVIATERDGATAVLVTVRDSGPGLRPENFARLFDAFYTTKPGGMGMGLSICRSIVEAHGGQIWSAVDVVEGASFQFTLPAYVAPAADEP
jgi:PAS domain S-box-containing protein